jgi:hypothetical protein
MGLNWAIDLDLVKVWGEATVVTLIGVHLISVPKVTVGFALFHRALSGNS